MLNVLKKDFGNDCKFFRLFVFALIFGGAVLKSIVYGQRMRVSFQDRETGLPVNDAGKRLGPANRNGSYLVGSKSAHTAA